MPMPRTLISSLFGFVRKPGHSEFFADISHKRTRNIRFSEFRSSSFVTLVSNNPVKLANAVLGVRDRRGIESP